MKLTLHHAYQSRSQRVLWLLYELGVEFELIQHNFFDKSLRSEDYLAISPAGRVPALEIDGEAMLESGAMVDYLCECFPAAGLGRAVGDPERRLFLDLLHYAETIGQHCANLTQSHLVLYEDWMRSPTQMGLEAKRLFVTLKRLDAMLSDGREFLLPTGFSGVDCAVAYGAVIGQKFTDISGLAHLQAYLTRISNRPAFIKSWEKPKGVPAIYTKDFYEVPNVEKD
ncbi:MAG: glutathione S-transferase family protein [Halocynthiibacter sp.]